METIQIFTSPQGSASKPNEFFVVAEEDCYTTNYILQTDSLEIDSSLLNAIQKKIEDTNINDPRTAYIISITPLPIKSQALLDFLKRR